MKRYGTCALTPLRWEGNFLTVTEHTPDRRATWFESGVCTIASGLRSFPPARRELAQTSPGAFTLRKGILTMWLENCSDEEVWILAAIAALAVSLPRTLADYADALTEINRNYFHPVPKLDMQNPAGRSVTQTLTPRARPPWK